MAKVQPIRDLKRIKAIKNMLKGSGAPRNYLLFTLGINFALRISDLLKLRITDILDKKGTVRGFILLKEKKTARAARIRINDNSREAIEYFLENTEDWSYEEPLFKSKRSERPLDPSAVYRLIQKWTAAVGLTKENYGTHTLRKTWGYMARKRFSVPIELIQAKFGHASPAVTKAYIGIEDDEIENVESEVNL
ncbi:MAG: tyrosine-type recombinase/integrase [Elusimicrobia bacterium]|jgi:integrase|nr:tyrosine-type recombinase/integrase [Elusimicrobiota bacterium]